MPNKAVFFDRDGVINRDTGYVGAISDFEFLPGVPDALCRIRHQGYLLILCTNQSGIARGRYLLSDFLRTTAWMQQVLSLHDAAFDGIYFCPHHPQAAVERYRLECDCRKPKGGMFKKACADFCIDPCASFAVGDRMRDLEGARVAGITNVALIGSDETERKKEPDILSFANLYDFASYLGHI